MSSHHKTLVAKGLHVIAYRATLDVSRELVAYVASLLAAHRRVRGTRRRSRALSCGKQENHGPWRGGVARRRRLRLVPSGCLKTRMVWEPVPGIPGCCPRARVSVS